MASSHNGLARIRPGTARWRSLQQMSHGGAVCPDEFVGGYGMDWGGKLRSLPFVGVVRRELYES